MDIFWILGCSPCPKCGIITEHYTRNGATMRSTQFSPDTIIALLGKQTIASLPEVMAALGARASRRTAFRKLKDLAARTSYSHRAAATTPSMNSSTSTSAVCGRSPGSASPASAP